MIMVRTRTGTEARTISVICVSVVVKKDIFVSFFV